MFKGTYTAMVTPFRNGQVDVKAFEALIERQVAAGIEGIVPVGTTGESPTLNMQEHVRVIELAVQFAKKRTQVVAGTGSNSTAEAIELSLGAQRAKADALLLVAPYYNKPSPEGMFQHFRAIARAVELPIMLYSVPGRCGVEITVETVGRLAKECPTIRSIKEAGGKAERVDAIRQVVPSDFEILSGDDGITVEFMKRGAVGVVSVASNLIPAEVKSLVDAAGRRIGRRRKNSTASMPVYSVICLLKAIRVRSRRRWPPRAGLRMNSVCLLFPSQRAVVRSFSRL